MIRKEAKQWLKPETNKDDSLGSWFKLQHDTETGQPYQGKRVWEVDQYNKDPDRPPSKHHTDTDDDLKEEE